MNHRDSDFAGANMSQSPREIYDNAMDASNREQRTFYRTESYLVSNTATGLGCHSISWVVIGDCEQELSYTLALRSLSTTFAVSHS